MLRCFVSFRESRLLLNEGHPKAKPTVVLGVSGKPEKMCNLELVQRDKVRKNERAVHSYESIVFILCSSGYIISINHPAAAERTS